MPKEKRQRKKERHQARQAAMRAAQRRALTRRRAVATVVVVGLFAAVVAIIAAAQGGGSKKVKTTTPTTAATATTPTTAKTATLTPVAEGASVKGATPCPKADGSSPRTTKFEKAPPMCIDPARPYTAVMKTDKGTITIALDPKKAPKTVNNFVVLARYHYYDGVAFHRIIPDFVDQVGDLTETGTGGPGYTFEDELPQPGDYKAGSVAMANSGPNTNGSQIFLVASANGAKALVEAVGGQAKYSLFGQITGGLDVTQAINKLGTSDGQPTEVVKIESVTIQEG